MIPILYGSKVTAFENNGLGRLRDCISCVVTEERNGIYECDFEYPVNGANYEKIRPGRIVGVTHDEKGDIQPFYIVSYSRPIEGVVSFHCVHISYKLSGLTVSGKNINSLSSALSLLGTATPSSRFTFNSDFSASGYMAAADGTPRSVRQMLGGIEGSILDAYGGEYVFNKFNVTLKKKRGIERDFAIRYGVNLLEYSEETDYSGTFNACIPFWKGQNDNGADVIVKGSKVTSGASTYSGNQICVPLDLSDKFENKPTTAQLQREALAYMQSNQTALPSQSIEVNFVRLSELGEFDQFESLLKCSLCDTVKVIFPTYGMEGKFKIVKTVWDVLRGKYESMELGKLSRSLADALGITDSLDATRDKAPTLIDDDFRVTGDVYAGVNTDGTGGRKLVSASMSSETFEAVAVPSGMTYKSLGSFTLEPGAYVVLCMADFGANATGRRALRLYNVTGGAEMAISRVTLPAVSGTNTRIQSIFLTSFSGSNITYSLECYQTSGAELSVTGYVRIIKLS